MAAERRGGALLLAGATDAGHNERALLLNGGRLSEAEFRAALKAVSDNGDVPGGHAAWSSA
jgi:hypothetical protein